MSELRVQIRVGGTVLDEAWADLRRAWSETSWRLRRLCDDPQCADEEFAAATAESAPGLTVALAFDPQEDISAPYVARGVRPAVAILREQGVNSQVETAAGEADIGCASPPFRDGQPDVADAWSAAERASLRNIRAALDPERVLAFQRHPAF